MFERVLRLEDIIVDPLLYVLGFIEDLTSLLFSISAMSLRWSRVIGSIKEVPYMILSLGVTKSSALWGGGSADCGLPWMSSSSLEGAVAGGGGISYALSTCASCCARGFCRGLVSFSGQERLLSDEFLLCRLLLS
jgi:hypothetical protein